MLFGMLRRSGGEKQFDVSGVNHPHGYIFCAAHEVHKLSDSVLTACDADRLCTVLANLLELAKALKSPEADQEEMAEWHQALNSRVTVMRTAERCEERAPDCTPVEVYIRTGLLPERQRATA